MENINLYWPVYKNLEKEVLELSYHIHFSDNQLEVFSVQIAELLIRCAVEIESLSKSLYQNEGGNMEPVDASGNVRYLNYDFDCLKMLDQLWKLGKKQIVLAAPSMYFKEEENKVFTPLKNAHKGDVIWQKAYQAVKHSRVEKLHEATVRALLRAMAALYLLNLYNQNDVFEIGTVEDNGKSFNPSLQSDIFSVKYKLLSNFPYRGNELDDLSDITYVGIFIQTSYKELEEEYKIMNKKVTDYALAKIMKNPKTLVDSATSKLKDVWSIAFDKSDNSGAHIPGLVGSFGKKLLSAKLKAVLNKNQELKLESS